MRVGERVGGAGKGRPWSGENTGAISLQTFSCFACDIPQFYTLQLSLRQLPQTSCVLLFQPSPLLPTHISRGTARAVLSTHLQPVRNGNIQPPHLLHPIVKNMDCLRWLQLGLCSTVNTLLHESLNECHSTHQHRRVILPLHRHRARCERRTNTNDKTKCLIQILHEIEMRRYYLPAPEHRRKLKTCTLSELNPVACRLKPIWPFRFKFWPPNSIIPAGIIKNGRDRQLSFFLIDLHSLNYEKAPWYQKSHQPPCRTPHQQYHIDHPPTSLH